MVYARVQYGRWAVKSLLAAFILLVIILTENAFTVVHGEVAQRMIPIIEAYRAAFGASHAEYETAWDKADNLLGDLSHDKTPASDEASATLLCYYLGAHTEEEMMENVIARGPRELPYLVEYRKRRPVLLRVDLDLLLTDSGTCHFDLDEAIKEINKGGK